MALTGTYTRTLDDKQRLAVPRRLCEEFGEPEIKVLIVAPGSDGSLALYSPAAFDRIARKMAKLTSNRKEVRHFKRLLFGRAERVELDAQGRIRIPDRLVDLAKLSGEVVLVGVHDHAEVWNSAAWAKFLDETSPGFDEIAEVAFE
jgi:MraZ protein